MNYAVIKRKPGIKSLVGIYPTKDEADFMQNLSIFKGKDVRVEKTDNEPTSTKVKGYLDSITGRFPKNAK